MVTILNICGCLDYFLTIMIQVIMARVKTTFLKQGHCYQIYEVQWVAFAFLNLYPHLADSSIRSLAA